MKDNGLLLLFVVGLLGFPAAAAAQIATLSTISTGIICGVIVFFLFPIALLIDRQYRIGNFLSIFAGAILTVIGMWATATIFSTGIGVMWGIFFAGLLVFIWAICALDTLGVFKK